MAGSRRSAARPVIGLAALLTKEKRPVCPQDFLKASFFIIQRLEGVLRHEWV